MFEPTVNANKNIKNHSALKIWLFPVVSLVVVLVVGVFVIRVWVEDIFNQRQLIIDQKKQLSLLVPKLESLSIQDTEQLKQYLIQLELAVPAQASPPLILATTEQALNSAGLLIENIAYGGLSQGGFVSDVEGQSSGFGGGAVKLQLSAKGEFYQVVAFLKAIQQLNPLVLSNELEVRKSTEIEGTIQQELTFSAGAPFQPLPEDLGEITAEVESLDQAALELIESLGDFETPIAVPEEVEGRHFEVGKENPF